MKIINEITSRDFGFWSGAMQNLEDLKKFNGDYYNNLLDALDNNIDDCYPTGITSTELNDIVWFDFDNILEWINVRRGELDEPAFVEIED